MSSFKQETALELTVTPQPKIKPLPDEFKRYWGIIYTEAQAVNEQWDIHRHLYRRGGRRQRETLFDSGFSLFTTLRGILEASVQLGLVALLDEDSRSVSLCTFQEQIFEAVRKESKHAENKAKGLLSDFKGKTKGARYRRDNLIAHYNHKRMLAVYGANVKSADDARVHKERFGEDLTRGALDPNLSMIKLAPDDRAFCKDIDASVDALMEFMDFVEKTLTGAVHRKSVLGSFGSLVRGRKTIQGIWVERLVAHLEFGKRCTGKCWPDAAENDC